MRSTAHRRILTAVLGVSALLTAGRASAQGLPSTPTSIHDPRLADLRRASAAWDGRQGPPRRVVDQVCLVPDLASYYEAIAAWDGHAYFPILIDDVELTLKFLRAFRPARVIRFKGRGRPVESTQVWETAIRAVGDAWSEAGAPEETRPRGDTIPARIADRPPGVVLGRAESPSLPGLVALAAGRFQPLLALNTAKTYGDVLNPAELKRFADDTEAAVRAAIPEFERLGDDCDFVTLAGDYPYRYASPRGLMAVDDRVARSGPRLARWAFTGRLLGDAHQSVYAAMCSLFLRPESALMFNGYPEDSTPWSVYALRDPADRLRPILPTALVSGERRATIKGWHETFDPINRHGLLFVNTKGSPSVFDLVAGPAHALDVMPSVPTAIAIIHSYSAADPTDPGTIAGRWLAQGAYAYHGAVDEPFLAAFRVPAVVAELLSEGIPYAAALRATVDEPFGEPWKLTFLGDPLLRLLRRAGTPDRAREFAPTETWPVYGEGPRPGFDAEPAARLAWAVNAAIVRETSSAQGTPADDIPATLRSIPRGDLAPALRPVLDELTILSLFRARLVEEIRATYRKIPTDERTPVATRLALSAVLMDFQRALGRRDLERAGLLWADLIGFAADRAFRSQVTARAAAIADTPTRRQTWRDRLRSAGAEGDAREVVAEELKRVEEAIRADRAGPGR